MITEDYKNTEIVSIHFYFYYLCILILKNKDCSTYMKWQVCI